MSNQGSTLMAHCGAQKVTRGYLREIPIPEATRSHQPLSHFEIVNVLEEALSYRHLGVIRDEYAVSKDGMKMFGVMDLNSKFDGGNFSIGLRNSNDKSMRLALTAGYRVFVCDNMAFSGDFTPLLHKHTSKLNLRDSIAIAVDRIHRGLESLGGQIKAMREFGLSDNDARLLIYRAFMERVLKGVPRHLMPIVHDNYFETKHDEFRLRNLWSLSNAFTSAFKSLIPLKQFEVTAKLGTFMTEVQAHSIRRPEESLGIATNRLQENSEDLYEGYDEFLDEVAKSQPFEKMPEPQSEKSDSDLIEAEDLAEDLSNVTDYFDEESEDENVEEYERRAAA